MGCGGSKHAPSTGGEAIRMTAQSRAAPSRQRTQAGHQRDRPRTAATNREREGGRATSSRPRTQRATRQRAPGESRRQGSRAHNRPSGQPTIREERGPRPEDSAIEEHIANLNYLIDQHTQTYYNSELAYVRQYIGQAMVNQPIQFEVDGKWTFPVPPTSATYAFS
jgi:hypothetical protein